LFAVSPRTASVVLAASLAVTPLALPASASAAAKPCLLGKWKLTKYSMNAKGPGSKATSWGGQGVRLTVAEKSVTYDFGGSKPIIIKGFSDGEKYDMKTTYRKRLTLKSTLKGAKKGTLALKPKSAKGDARAALVMNGAPFITYSVAKVYREGSWEPVAPTRARYTCTAKTARFKMTETDESGTGTVVLDYRRL